MPGEVYEDWAKVVFLKVSFSVEGTPSKCHLGEKWHPFIVLFLINAIDNRPCYMGKHNNKTIKNMYFLIRKINCKHICLDIWRSK